ncbi:hypothetical protein F5876DRAFT_82348 [Lentinula aff. lateritia]|uniref:Uncharacterized protein n=1 Tax=Lentinula aff. lateritia TaxID=2804960 RepID=A0ACC1TKE3_9AGAR|nr:hypothetical protein F5876DRAFT_82348 [Lentinula aff. lateritia]
MSPAPARLISCTPSPLLPTLTALREVPSPAPESDGEVERDQLAFTIESPSRPQLQLFETVFNTGKPLEANPEPPHRVWLVVPPGRSVVAPSSVPAPPRTSPSLMEVPSRDLVWLAAVAEAHSGLVWQAISPPSARMPIKGVGQDLLSSAMPPTPRPTLVPRTFTAHPYRAENQHLVACVHLLESQLADSQRENSSLTSALRDTSHALESRQREVEQLCPSSRETLKHEVEYRRVLDQFHALDEALPGAPGRSLLEHFRKVQGDLQDATRERKVAVEKLSTSTHKNSHLTTTLLHQQGLVDESNALATRQRRLVEELQEEVHRARGRAAFVDQMIKEYPDEGYYEVVLPPLSQLEGDLNQARQDLRRVATFAHCLYHSDPATVLHHYHCYIGAIIEAVVAFLRRGLNSNDLDVVVHNFRLALDYMQAARGVHSDLYMWSMSSIQWFFNNAVDEDEGLYRMVLEHSQFENDGPFLMAAQHAGFAPPPDNSLEPPLHQRMLVLSTALPHSAGTGMWDDIVPALPNTPAPMQSLEALVAPVSSPSIDPPSQVPLFLPEQESPTSPSPPPPSPTLPPLFGFVANLAIDLTSDDDELYETEESRVGRVSVTREVVDLPAGQGTVKEESL